MNPILFWLGAIGALASFGAAAWGLVERWWKVSLVYSLRSEVQRLRRELASTKDMNDQLGRSLDSLSERNIVFRRVIKELMFEFAYRLTESGRSLLHIAHQHTENTP